MKTKQYQPKTGQPCGCKPGQERDNCPNCEGTGQRIDFAAIRARTDSGAKEGSYRTLDGKAQIEWSLERKENGLEFSACGDFDGSGGQNIDTIAKAYPNDVMVQRIFKVWKRYHLNGMNSGTPEQQAEVARRRLLAEEYARKDESDAGKHFYDKELTQANWHSLCHKFGHDSYFDWECAILREANLYEVKVPADVKATGGFPEEVTSGERGYRFGERWLFVEIPAEVIAEIESWTTNATESHGEFTAEKFLKSHGIKFRATLSDSKTPAWKADGERSGHHYRVTLSKRVSTGTHGKDCFCMNCSRPSRLVFDFWGSIADAEKGETTVTPYDVLTCISSDVHTPETFEDYCSEFGEDQDSIKALQTFRRCSAFAKRLRAFFTVEEINELSEIR